MVFFLINMDKKFYTSKEAAELLGVTDARIRQMAIAGEIEHERFGRALMITFKGIQQAKERKTQPGPKAQIRRAA